MEVADTVAARALHIGLYRHLSTRVEDFARAKPKPLSGCEPPS